MVSARDNSSMRAPSLRVVILCQCFDPNSTSTTRPQTWKPPYSRRGVLFILCCPPHLTRKWRVATNKHASRSSVVGSCQCDKVRRFKSFTRVAHTFHCAASAMVYLGRKHQALPGEPSIRPERLGAVTWRWIRHNQAALPSYIHTR